MVFCCSGECGIGGIGTVSLGTRHWNFYATTSTVTVATSPGSRGTRCLRFNFAAAQAQIGHAYATAIPSPATLVSRFYIWFVTLPTGSGGFDVPLGPINANGIAYRESDGKLYGYDSAAPTTSASGFAVSTGQWYCIDVKLVFDTTHTVDVQITPLGGSTTILPQVSVAGAPNTFGSNAYGHGSGTVTGEYYIRDIIESSNAADYPIGPGQGYALFPNADRTNSAATPTDGNKGHLFSATTDFGKGASGATATGAQNAESTSWQSLDNPLVLTAGGSWIADLLGAGTEHMVWELDNLPSDASAVNGVMLVCTTHSASATTNEFRAGIGNPSALKAASVGPLDISETTLVVCDAPVTTDASAAAWNVAKVNATTIWFGDSADVNPDPYLDGACLEVDVVRTPPVVMPVQPIVPVLAAQQGSSL